MYIPSAASLHTAVWLSRPVGAVPPGVTSDHVAVWRLKKCRSFLKPLLAIPPKMYIPSAASLHTAVCSFRCVGAVPLKVTSDHVAVWRLKKCRSLKRLLPSQPPKMYIPSAASLHTAVCSSRAVGAVPLKVTSDQCVAWRLKKCRSFLLLPSLPPKMYIPSAASLHTAVWPLRAVGAVPLGVTSDQCVASTKAQRSNIQSAQVGSENATRVAKTLLIRTILDLCRESSGTTVSRALLDCLSQDVK